MVLRSIGIRITFSILWSGLLQNWSHFIVRVIHSNVAEVPANEVPGSPSSNVEINMLPFNLSSFIVLASDLGHHFVDSLD